MCFGQGSNRDYEGVDHYRGPCLGQLPIKVTNRPLIVVRASGDFYASSIAELLRVLYGDMPGSFYPRAGAIGDSRFEC